ncbi:MAG: ANTAR domain-containing protein [Lachnospiraceae bacterium]|nr:ANTAR domain-containing protein [Lachnospiraceae bacterium]
MTNIIVVFPKLEDAKNIRNILARSGLQITAVCTSGANALAAMEGLNDGIVICGYRFHDMLYYDLYQNLPRYFELLLITSRVHLQEAQNLGIMCITMPLRVAELVETVNMMSDVITRKRRKRKEQPVRRNEADRKYVDEAKKLLMERNHMSESEAHRYIQKNSMDTGTNMVETARMILSIMTRDRKE